MTIDEVRMLMEESGIEEEKINEFLVSLEKNESESKEKAYDRITAEWEMKNQMDNEIDWRKKAQIAARIISLNLE